MAKITLVFFYPHIKSIHESLCTQVLQSANIRNWHKLLYTYIFEWMKKNKSLLVLPGSLKTQDFSGSIYAGLNPDFHRRQARHKSQRPLRTTWF